jgi:hypothetical protein
MFSQNKKTQTLGQWRMIAKRRRKTNLDLGEMTAR